MSIVRRFFRSQIARLVALAILVLAVGVVATATFRRMSSDLPDWQPWQRSLQPLFYLRVPTGPPAGATSAGDEERSFSLPVFEALRQDRRAFSEVMAFAPLGKDKVAVQQGDVSEEATGEMVSGNFFSGLGVKMQLGGGFKMEDEQRHSPVVVLSFAYWTHLYSRDPGIAGQVIYIGGVPFAVLGVTAEGFAGVEPGRPVDFWIPLQSRSELKPWGSAQALYGSPHWWCLRLMARLAPGVDAQRAVAEATPGFRAAAYAGLDAPAAGQSKVALSLVPATDTFSRMPAKDTQRHSYRELALVVLATLLLLECIYVAMRIRAWRAARRASGRRRTTAR